MLDKNNQTRITSEECLNHPWLGAKFYENKLEINHAIAAKLRDFRAPKTLQKETLKFLVNNLTSDMNIDFKSMREAFRAIDTSNSGIITLE